MIKLISMLHASHFSMVRSPARCGWLISGVLLLALFISSIPSLAFAAGDSGLKVTNAALVENVLPGQTLTEQMTVSIGSADQAVNLSVQVYGLAQTSSGGYQRLDASQDTGAYSARTFVSVDNSSFHLEPGGSQLVTATISVPQDVGNGGRYAVIYISTDVTSGGGGVGIISAINVPVFLTIKDSQLSYTGDITSLTVGQVVSRQAVNISTIFQNTGNVHCKVKGLVNISNANGALLSSVSEPLTSSSIIPGMSRELKASYMPGGELPAGVYTVVSKVMLNDSTVLDESSTTFTVETAYVPPPGVGSITLTPSLAATLTSADGLVSIYFPAGSVLAPVNISLQGYTLDQLAALPSGVIAAGTCFQVGGLSGLLVQDAIVTVKYTSDDLASAGGDVSKLKLARWDEASGWTILDTTADETAMTLSASTNQMSIWAVVVGSNSATEHAKTSSVPTVAIIIGVIVVALVIVMMIFLVRRRRSG